MIRLVAPGVPVRRPAVRTTLAPLGSPADLRARTPARPRRGRRRCRRRPCGPTRTPHSSCSWLPTCSSWTSATIGRAGRYFEHARAPPPVARRDDQRGGVEVVGELDRGVQDGRGGALVVLDPAAAVDDRATPRRRGRSRPSRGTASTGYSPTPVSADSITARRPVDDRVGDVGGLGARRLGRVDHRLEHLRRGDHASCRPGWRGRSRPSASAARARRRPRRRSPRARP